MLIRCFKVLVLILIPILMFYGCALDTGYARVRDLLPETTINATKDEADEAAEEGDVEEVAKAIEEIKEEFQKLYKEQEEEVKTAENDDDVSAAETIAEKNALHYIKGEEYLLIAKTYVTKAIAAFNSGDVDLAYESLEIAKKYNQKAKDYVVENVLIDEGTNHDKDFKIDRDKFLKRSNEISSELIPGWVEVLDKFSPLIREINEGNTEAVIEKIQNQKKELNDRLDSSKAAIKLSQAFQKKLNDDNKKRNNELRKLKKEREELEREVKLRKDRLEHDENSLIYMFNEAIHNDARNSYNNCKRQLDSVNARIEELEKEKKEAKESIAELEKQEKEAAQQNSGAQAEYDMLMPSLNNLLVLASTKPVTDKINESQEALKNGDIVAAKKALDEAKKIKQKALDNEALDEELRKKVDLRIGIDQAEQNFAEMLVTTTQKQIQTILEGSKEGGIDSLEEALAKIKQLSEESIASAPEGFEDKVKDELNKPLKDAENTINKVLDLIATTTNKMQQLFNGNMEDFGSAKETLAEMQQLAENALENTPDGFQEKVQAQMEGFIDDTKKIVQEKADEFVVSAEKQLKLSNQTIESNKQLKQKLEGILVTAKGKEKEQAQQALEKAEELLADFETLKKTKQEALEAAKELQEDPYNSERFDEYAALKKDITAQEKEISPDVLECSSQYAQLVKQIDIEENTQSTQIQNEEITQAENVAQAQILQGIINLQTIQTQSEDTQEEEEENEDPQSQQEDNEEPQQQEENEDSSSQQEEEGENEGSPEQPENNDTPPPPSPNYTQGRIVGLNSENSPFSLQVEGYDDDLITLKDLEGNDYLEVSYTPSESPQNSYASISVFDEANKPLALYDNLDEFFIVDDITNTNAMGYFGVPTETSTTSSSGIEFYSSIPNEILSVDSYDDFYGSCYVNGSTLQQGTNYNIIDYSGVTVNDDTVYRIAGIIDLGNININETVFSTPVVDSAGYNMSDLDIFYFGTLDGYNVDSDITVYHVLNQEYLANNEYEVASGAVFGQNCQGFGVDVNVDDSYICSAGFKLLEDKNAYTGSGSYEGCVIGVKVGDVEDYHSERIYSSETVGITYTVDFDDDHYIDNGNISFYEYPSSNEQAFSFGGKDSTIAYDRETAFATITAGATGFLGTFALPAISYDSGETLIVPDGVMWGFWNSTVSEDVYPGYNNFWAARMDPGDNYKPKIYGGGEVTNATGNYYAFYAGQSVATLIIDEATLSLTTTGGMTEVLLTYPGEVETQCAVQLMTVFGDDYIIAMKANGIDKHSGSTITEMEFNDQGYLYSNIMDVRSITPMSQQNDEDLFSTTGNWSLLFADDVSGEENEYYADSLMYKFDVSTDYWHRFETLGLAAKTYYQGTDDHVLNPYEAVSFYGKTVGFTSDQELIDIEECDIADFPIFISKDMFYLPDTQAKDYIPLNGLDQSKTFLASIPGLEDYETITWGMWSVVTPGDNITTAFGFVSMGNMDYATTNEELENYRYLVQSATAQIFNYSGDVLGVIFNGDGTNTGYLTGTITFSIDFANNQGYGDNNKISLNNETINLEDLAVTPMITGQLILSGSTEWNGNATGSIEGGFFNDPDTSKSDVDRFAREATGVFNANDGSRTAVGVFGSQGTPQE